RTRLLSDRPVLKVKLGFEGDVELVASLRKIYGGRIRIDANEGWTPPQAVERLRALQDFDVELCEQPIPAGNHQELRAVTEGTAIPIYADEDVCTAGDVARLAG